MRTKAPVLQATTADFTGELALARGGIAFVPAADELPDELQAELFAALAAPPDPERPTTWVLGVMPGTSPASLASHYRTLHLTPHLATAGADR